MNQLWMIDLLKVVAAQVILWHHFCRYGPLARTIESAGHDWVNVIGNHGRHAVQVFLVLSGFLAARSVSTFFTTSSLTELAKSLQRAWVVRVWRLGKPYWLMLLVTMTVSAIARQIQPDIDTPAAPHWWQVLTHILFLQDIFASDALSTGVWYVAIDLQLSLLFWFLLLACGALTAKAGNINPAKAERALEIIVWLLMLMALFALNRWRSIDVWAVYFFGSFGIGVVTGFRLVQVDRKTSLFWILLVSTFGIAMAIEWRPGLLVALASAALLWRANSHPEAELDQKRLPHLWLVWLSRLSRESYPLFLFHYPVVLLIGTMINLYWPEQVIPSMLGLMASWAISMLIAFSIAQVQTKRSAYKNRSKILRPARSNFL
jgi:peptidoglycan/LPS O-acetylase OafA/YrhL